MTKQNFKNHIRFYAPHHFIFYPVCLFLIGCTTYKTIVSDGEFRWIWAMLLLIVILLTWFSFMVRQHYAIGLQDRMIREEIRFRYFKLTGKDFDLVAGSLRTRQIVALRFASDEELPALIENALDTQLTPNQIKQSIENWKGDYWRV
ncbi:MAG TPA: DUF6526 family protein [Niabella sp.]|nr:DUF6526 family protein [Niabella sp.]HOZ95661.1 DUF6526 family protein [Niabella sp.]HQW13901.1 DUF6526 family protein [Niabella sp.]HQX19206.1 DUF6526 family protein [Niabella sp.]HQX41344.1 DUF6526 family protein [Niabella sp.]